MQTGRNKAGGVTVESRGKTEIWKVVRPKSAAMFESLCGLLRQQQIIGAFCITVKVLVSRAHWAPVIIIFICLQSQSNVSAGTNRLFFTSTCKLFGMFRRGVLWLGQSWGWAHGALPLPAELAPSQPLHVRGCRFLLQQPQKKRCRLAPWKDWQGWGEGLRPVPCCCVGKCQAQRQQGASGSPCEGVVHRQGAASLLLLSIMFSAASAESTKQHLLLPATRGGLWEAVRGRERSFVCPSCP